MHEAQKQAFTKMSPAEKLHIAGQLYLDARELKRAGIRMLRPELTEEEVERRVREAFLYARS